MKVFRSSRLLLRATASPRGELVGYLSSSDTFPPSHLCHVWSFVQITSEAGDRVGCEGRRGCGMEEGVAPFLFSELLDCLSCFPETAWPWCLLGKTRALQLQIVPKYWARVSPGGRYLPTLQGMSGRSCNPRDH